MRFDDAFDGVLLAYEIKFQDKAAKILPGIVPYFGVRVKAKLLIFSPKPEMLLEGKVVKLGRESIHVIVLGFSSAVITSEDVREEFRYKIKHDKEVFVSTSYRKHVIKVGTILRFSVKSFDEEMLHISGSLIPEDTGCIRWLYRHTTDGLLHEHVTQGSSEIERTSKKHKGKSKEMSLQEQDSVEVSGRSNMSMINSDRPHKSKKRRIYDS
ncbi:uncharacterized protein [Aristolochia californica]|uniref:uncharacterized protein isoform X2 n=1 Tax=Aristolochia californica TaxID=171875 RepID=UPI0035D7C8E0